MRHANDLLSYLRSQGPSPAADAVTDGQLVERFVQRRDEAAFYALLRRHGLMVWGVCRRLLQNQADAEDAFQATFLVLVRKAGSIVPPALVGNWLYGVAYRAAQKALALRARRREHERRAAAMRNIDAAESEAIGDLQQLLDQELVACPRSIASRSCFASSKGKPGPTPPVNSVGRKGRWREGWRAAASCWADGSSGTVYRCPVRVWRRS